MEEVLATLSFASSPFEPIGRDEVAFLTSANRQRLRGLANFDGLQVFAAKERPQFPAYDHLAPLRTDIANAIARLQLRGVLKETKSGFYLAHSYYEAAAESLFQNSTMSVERLLVKTLRRGLFCLSPRTSRVSARSLDTVFEIFEPSPDGRRRLIHLAKKGLENSIFPATRDGCLRFLSRRSLEFPTDTEVNIDGFLHSATRISLWDLRWHNGEPWLSSESGPNLDAYLPPRIERSAISEDLTTLESGGASRLPPERAFKLLTFFASKPSEMPGFAALRLLAYDEGVIRADAARIWYRRNDRRTAKS